MWVRFPCKLFVTLFATSSWLSVLSWGTIKRKIRNNPTDSQAVWITLSGWWIEVAIQEPYIQNNDGIKEGSIFKSFSRKFPNQTRRDSWNFNGLSHQNMSAISRFEISFKQKDSAQISGAGSQRRISFVLWCLHVYGSTWSSLMSPFWYLESWGGS